MQLNRAFYFLFLTALLLTFCSACQTSSQPKAITVETTSQAKPIIHNRIKNEKVIHVFVALCDNKYQGIVPVPPKIGNGQDPANNLYWGCSYGVKSYFKNSKDWILQKNIFPVAAPILERCVYKHKLTNTWMVADAYDGQFIKQCTQDFLGAASGIRQDSVTTDAGHKLFAAGNADLLAYIGHDGLMDFRITESYPANDSMKRETIILACISKAYFAPILKQTKAIPVLWSTGLMAPEAYVLHDALAELIANRPNETIRTSAAAAYSKYQKCSLKAAKNLLVTGW